MKFRNTHVLSAALVAALATLSAQATPLTLGGYNFDTDDSVTAASVTTSGTTTLFFGVGIFPDDTVNSIATLLGAGSGEQAVDLATSSSSNLGRTELTLTWDAGDVLTNQSGDDFIIFEQGTETFVEAFGVAVREAGSSTFSSYRYEHYDSSDPSVGGKNITAYDLSDFGISASGSIDAIRIINIHNASANTPAGGPEEDRVDDASGEGTVLLDAGSGSGFEITTGPAAGQGNVAYNDGGLDADILYVVALNSVGPEPVSTISYCDDFNTDTSAAYSIQAIDQFNPGGSEDYSVTFAYDYSAFVVGDTDGTTIPVAPNTTDTSQIGLRISVNDSDDDASAAEGVQVNLFPISGEVPAGTNYSVKFDAFISYNGDAFGGSGSTEFLLAGAALDGLASMGGLNDGATAAAAVDGVTIAVTGEGGGADDYVVYVGDGTVIESTDPPDGALTPADAGYVDTTTNQTGALYAALFPDRSPEVSDTLGTPGKRWVTFTLNVNDDTATWIMESPDDGTSATIASIPVGTLGVGAGGFPMLGYQDTFSSVAAPAVDNFVIFDNFCVEEIITTNVGDFSLYR